ncbi:unnamed protein product, partial [Didymodactylos carnosus]
MLAASQDIDNFIERQRRQLNADRTGRSPNVNNNVNVNDRLDFKVARILDEPPPQRRGPGPQSAPISYQQPPPQPLSLPPLPPTEQSFEPFSRRSSGDQNDITFFQRFGTYDERRSQLKQDLKREYNDFLRSKKSKSTSQLNHDTQNEYTAPHDNRRRVQFNQRTTRTTNNNGKEVVAPWEKDERSKTIKAVQSMNDLSAYESNSSGKRSNLRNTTMDYSVSTDEQYIRDRESYVLELQSQIRELEARKQQLESGMRSGSGSSGHAEDLSALNTLLAQRLSQRNAIDSDLARILNRPAISSSPSLGEMRISPRGGAGQQIRSQYSNNNRDQQQQYTQRPYENRSNRNQIQHYDNNDNQNGGFQIGREADKDAEQANKKRYQQELQQQMREAQMRKMKEKADKDEYDRKLEADIQTYNYFGRGGGGAPMRDKDGNVVANLADLNTKPPQMSSRQPPSSQQYQHPQPPSQQYQHQQDDKIYQIGTSSIHDAPYYNGEQVGQNSVRPESPNYARGGNGIFGNAKTDAQKVQEEKYKQDLKRQIEDKRQRAIDEKNKVKAEEEKEIGRLQAQQQKIQEEYEAELVKKKDKEAQAARAQEQLHDQLERQKQEDNLMKRRSDLKKRRDNPQSQDNNENENNEHNGGIDQDHNNQESNFDNNHHQQRTSSPPVPALMKQGTGGTKKTLKNERRPSIEQLDLNNNDMNENMNGGDGSVGNRQTYRKPPTSRQPGTSQKREQTLHDILEKSFITDITPKRKPPQTTRQRQRSNSNGGITTGMPMRTNSNISLRSDGSSSEVLNRLENMKRQLKDKEERLRLHVERNHNEQSTTNSGLLSDIDELDAKSHKKTTYIPPDTRKKSPFLTGPTRVRRDSSQLGDGKSNKFFNVFHEDEEFKPQYFRDDSILLPGSNYRTNDEYASSSKRVDFADGMFPTSLEDAIDRRQVRRRQADPPRHYDR